MEQPDWIQMLEKMQDIRQFCGNHVKRVIKGGITSAQELDLLSRLALDQEARTPQLLCRGMGISKPMLSRLIEHLEQKGFVKKRVLARDKRSYELFITPMGKEELERTYSYYMEPVYRLYRAIGPEDFELLTTLIRRSNELESRLEQEGRDE